MIAVLSTIGLVAVAFNVFFHYSVDCRSVLLRSVQSPTADYIATVSTSTCKTPSNSGTHLYLQKAGLSEQRGFKIYDNSSTEFDLTWESHSTLIVGYPRGGSLLAGARDIYGVDIRFEPR